VRNEVWQRIFALLLYMAGLVILVIGPAGGGDRAGPCCRSSSRTAGAPTVSYWVGTLY